MKTRYIILTLMLFGFTLSTTVEATTITKSFSGVIDAAGKNNPFGVKIGNDFQWSITYDLSLVQNLGTSIVLSSDNLPFKISINIGNKVFHEYDDKYYPELPIIWFNDGNIFSMDVTIEYSKYIFKTVDSERGFTISELATNAVIVSGRFNYPGMVPLELQQSVAVNNASNTITKSIANSELTATASSIAAYSPNYEEPSYWSLMSSGTFETLNDVWVADMNNVWAVGNNGTILHYDGTAWTPVECPVCISPITGAKVNILKIWGRSPNEFYAAGANGLQVGNHDGQWYEMGAIPHLTELMITGIGGDNNWMYSCTYGGEGASGQAGGLIQRTQSLIWLMVTGRTS